MEYPACPHLIDVGEKFKTCKIIADQSGGIIRRVTPAMCQATCKVNGPYCGINIPTEQEAHFVLKILLAEFSYNKENFLNRLLNQYDRPVDLVYPEKAWHHIKEALKGIPEIQKIFLTGSLTTVAGDNHKDYDILLQIANWEILNQLKAKLPSEICGIKCDYLFTTLRKIHDRFYCILDPENKILYTSSWYELKVQSNVDNITIVPGETLNISRQLKFELQQLKGLMPAPLPAAITPLIPITKKWSLVKDSWTRAQVFLTAIQSRGLLATALDSVNLDATQGERVDDVTYALRKRSCFGDETQPPCGQLKHDPDKNPFCGACGCGANKLAILALPDPNAYTKLHYPQLECPLNKPGFSNGPQGPT